MIWSKTKRIPVVPLQTSVCFLGMNKPQDLEPAVYFCQQIFSHTPCLLVPPALIKTSTTSLLKVTDDRGTTHMIKSIWGTDFQPFALESAPCSSLSALVWCPPLICKSCVFVDGFWGPDLPWPAGFATNAPPQLYSIGKYTCTYIYCYNSG